MCLCIAKLKETSRKFKTSCNHIKHLVLQGYKYTSVSSSFFFYGFVLITKAISFKFYILGKKTEPATGGILQEKATFKNFEKFTGNHLCWNIFFNEVEGLKFATLLKKRLQNWCFPESFAKLLRITTLKNLCKRQLLKRHTFTDP